MVVLMFVKLLSIDTVKIIEGHGRKCKLYRERNCKKVAGINRYNIIV